MLDHHPGVVVQRQRQVDSRQGFADRPAGADLAVLQQHQVIGQARHFVRRVADIEHRDVQFLVQAFEIGQDLALALQVEGCQRLVHQQQARAGEQGPGDADALLLAAGEAFRHAFQQVLDAQQGAGLFQLDAAFGGGDALETEGQVAPHRQVAEQVGILEHVAEGTSVGRDEEVAAAVLPGLAVDRHLALGGLFQAGDTAQASALAGA